MATMTNAEMQELFMRELRLMHYPIAIKYFFDQAELDAFKKNAPYYLPVKPLTFCQAEIGARMEGLTVLVEKENLGCANAKFVFGWKGYDEAEVKSHMKYVRNKEQAEKFVASKPRLPEDKNLLAVAVAPLGEAAYEPDVVHFYCDNMQAYHLAVDWMASQDVHPLQTNITMNSAACGGNVYSFNTGQANVYMACSGSYNAGKTERGEINVSIPGSQIADVAARLIERKEKMGGAAITRNNNPFPGADICKNCPLIVFKKGGEKEAAAE